MTEKEWQEKWKLACQETSDPHMAMLLQNWRDALLDYKKKKQTADDLRMLTTIVGICVSAFGIFVLAGIVADLLG